MPTKHKQKPIAAQLTDIYLKKAAARSRSVYNLFDEMRGIQTKFHFREISGTEASEEYTRLRVGVEHAIKLHLPPIYELIEGINSGTVHERETAKRMAMSDAAYGLHKIDKPESDPINAEEIAARIGKGPISKEAREKFIEYVRRGIAKREKIKTLQGEYRSVIDTLKAYLEKHPELSVVNGTKNMPGYSIISYMEADTELLGIIQEPGRPTSGQPLAVYDKLVKAGFKPEEIISLKLEPFLNLVRRGDPASLALWNELLDAGLLEVPLSTELQSTPRAKSIDDEVAKSKTDAQQSVSKLRRGKKATTASLERFGDAQPAHHESLNPDLDKRMEHSDPE